MMTKDPQRCPEPVHDVPFDESAAKGMSSYEVRKRWPRKRVTCTRCGFDGIAYASFMHYLMGDW